MRIRNNSIQQKIKFQQQPKMENNTNWNALRDRAYECAQTKGWHDVPHGTDHFLMLIVTEVAEAVNADRNGRRADRPEFERRQGMEVPPETQARRFKEDFDTCIKDTVEDELADVVIRCLDLAGLLGIDLQGGTMPECIEEGVKRIKTSQTFLFDKAAFELVRLVSSEDVNADMIVQAAIMAACWFAARLDFDILWHVGQKMKYNEFRGYRHGGKKY